MPKSKRNKQIELAKTKKRGLEWKKHLFGEVRSCVDSYANVFVFSVNDMRNSKMKNVREQWKHSRFFIGKNKIMAMALGRSAEEEYKPNLHKIGQEIKGQRGLLFSNKSTEEVLNWSRSYSEGDYARSGNVSTEEVRLPAGPLPMFPHSLEPYLRQLGLPTSLVKGQIHLVKDHEVCKAGDVLTPESAKILKLLGYEMAEFHITIDCMWSHDGSFIKFTENIDTDSKENMKKEKKKKKSINKKAAAEAEILDEDVEMEVENNLDEMTNNGLEDTKETNEPLTEVSKTSVTITSTPKAQNESSVGRNEVIEITIEDDVAAVDEEELASTDEEDVAIIDEEDVAVIDEDDVAVIEQEDVAVIEQEDVAVIEQEDVTVVDNQTSDVVNSNKSSTENTRPVTKRNRRSRAVKKDSLPKTPDANVSQESPVFRQLRNRSVKVSRKKK